MGGSFSNKGVVLFELRFRLPLEIFFIFFFIGPFDSIERMTISHTVL